MKELKNSVQSTETGKAAYVKPTMEVYEMEVEGAIMGDASDGGFNGRRSQAPSSRSSNNFPWDNESDL